MPDNETLSPPQGGDYLSDIIKAISSSSGNVAGGTEQEPRQGATSVDGGLSALASLLSGGAGGLTGANGVGVANGSSSGSAVGISGSTTNAASASAGAGGDILSSLLSNPELLSKLPSIISAIKPFIEMMSASAPTVSPSSTPKGEVQAFSPQVGGAQIHKSHDADCRTALLCAMKPYLSRSRCQAVDYIVKLGRLGDILKTL